MRRFYEQAGTGPAGAGFAISLDGRPVRTPARNLLEVPTLALAEAIAGEWNAQGEKVDPRSMPLTGLAYAAVDRVGPGRAAFAGNLARYGESDLLCYRGQGPEELVRRQAEAWDPLLAWARQRYDVDFEVVTGIVYRAQPERTVDRLGKAVAANGVFVLAALSPLVTISSSLLIALALAEGAVDLDAAWAAATVDEAWQTEQWGEDALAAAALAERRRDFEAARRFLSLL